MNIADMKPVPVWDPTEDTPDLRRAIVRLKGRKAAEALFQGRQIQNKLKDPAGCQTLVDNGASSKGQNYRSWQCKNPVRGQVNNKCYCAEHFETAQQAYLYFLDDCRTVRFHGYDPDNLPAIPAKT